MGDHILWFVDSSGVARGGCTWRNGRGTNVGDPTAANVDVFETNGLPAACPACGRAIVASVVSIRGAVIVGARLVVDEGHDPDLLAVVFDESGDVVARHSVFDPVEEVD